MAKKSARTKAAGKRSAGARELTFDPNFLGDLTYWVTTNKKIAEEILKLVEEIRRAPTEGTGKPERLKHMDSNTWSRRITQEHRLVYRIERERIVFLMCRYHYHE